MEYKSIKLKDGTYFLQRLEPDTASGNPLSKIEKIVLELSEREFPSLDTVYSHSTFVYEKHNAETVKKTYDVIKKLMGV